MGSTSLLLVDDDVDTTNILSELLEIKGYKVDVSQNGINALEKMKKKRYSAVILDYLLPYLNGDEAAEKIKDIDPGVGVILITGHKKILNERRLNDFDFILEKPVDPDQVVRVLRKVILYKATHKPSLLLVDDDPDTTKVLSEILKIKGFKVDISRDGFHALEMVQEKKYAVVILDYAMPYMNGDQVAEKMKELDPGVGILLITGHKKALDEGILADRRMNARCLNVFDFILEKPVSPDQVVKVLRKVISKQSRVFCGDPEALLLSVPQKAHDFSRPRG